MFGESDMTLKSLDESQLRCRRSDSGAALLAGMCVSVWLLEPVTGTKMKSKRFLNAHTLLR